MSLTPDLSPVVSSYSKVNNRTSVGSSLRVYMSIGSTDTSNGKEIQYGSLDEFGTQYIILGKEGSHRKEHIKSALLVTLKPSKALCVYIHHQCFCVFTVIHCFLESCRELHIKANVDILIDLTIPIEKQQQQQHSTGISSDEVPHNLYCGRFLTAYKDKNLHPEIRSIVLKNEMPNEKFLSSFAKCEHATRNAVMREFQVDTLLLYCDTKLPTISNDDLLSNAPSCVKSLVLKHSNTNEIPYITDFDAKCIASYVGKKIDTLSKCDNLHIVNLSLCRTILEEVTSKEIHLMETLWNFFVLKCTEYQMITLSKWFLEENHCYIGHLFEEKGNALTLCDIYPKHMKPPRNSLDWALIDLSLSESKKRLKHSAKMVNNERLSSLTKKLFGDGDDDDDYRDEDYCVGND